MKSVAIRIILGWGVLLTPLAVMPVSAQSSTSHVSYHCGKCGAQVGESASRCSSCGVRLHGGSSVSAIAVAFGALSEQPQETFDLIFWGSIGLFALAVLIVGVRLRKFL